MRRDKQRDDRQTNMDGKRTAAQRHTGRENNRNTPPIILASCATRTAPRARAVCTGIASCRPSTKSDNHCVAPSSSAQSGLHALRIWWDAAATK